MFLDLLDDQGLRIMNHLSLDPVTFVDKSHKPPKRCTLDLVITNNPESISDVKTDSDELKFTPYSVYVRKNVTKRVYTDHRSTIHTVKVKWKDIVRINKHVIWNYKKQLGDLRYDLYTSNAFPYLERLVREEPDINEVHKAFKDVVTKGKHVSYGKLSLTRRATEKLNNDLVWKNRLKDLDQLHNEFANESETNRIYKARKAILRGQQDRQTVAIKDEVTGERLEDPDSIMDAIIRYNVRNMEKIPLYKEVEEIQERKKAVIDCMLEEEKVNNFPSELS